MKNGSKKRTQNVTEAELLKSLGELEDDALAKGEDGDEGDEGSDDEESVEADDEENVEKGDDEDSDDDDEESSEEEEQTMKSKKKVKKGGKGGTLPGSTKEANGGFSQKDSDDEEGFETDAAENEPGKKGSKSMKSRVKEHANLQKAIEVSDFLESITDVQVASSDALRKAMLQFFAEQRAFNGKVAKALVAMGRNSVSMKKSMDEVVDSPVAARPRGLMTKSEDIQERFEDGDESGNGLQFTREQTLAVLMDMAMKSEIPTVAVSAYEATGHVEAIYVDKLNAALEAQFSRKKR